MTCKILEEMCIQERKKAMIEIAKRLLFDGTLTFGKIAEYTGLSPDKVKKLQVEQSV